MKLDILTFCPYCQVILMYNSNDDIYFCSQCKSSQQFCLAGKKTWLTFEINERGYSVLLDEVNQKTTLFLWNTTDDNYVISHKIWGIDALIPRLTPQNIQDKMKLFLTFS